MPSRFNIVGAISASFPFDTLRFWSSEISMMGTGFVVCAVLGVLSGLIARSAFP